MAASLCGGPACAAGGADISPDSPNQVETVFFANPNLPAVRVERGLPQKPRPATVRTVPSEPPAHPAAPPLVVRKAAPAATARTVHVVAPPRDEPKPLASPPSTRASAITIPAMVPPPMAHVVHVAPPVEPRPAPRPAAPVAASPPSAPETNPIHAAAPSQASPQTDAAEAAAAPVEPAPVPLPDAPPSALPAVAAAHVAAPPPIQPGPPSPPAAAAVSASTSEPVASAVPPSAPSTALPVPVVAQPTEHGPPPQAMPADPAAASLRAVAEPTGLLRAVPVLAMAPAPRLGPPAARPAPPVAPAAPVVLTPAVFRSTAANTEIVTFGGGTGARVSIVRGASNAEPSSPRTADLLQRGRVETVRFGGGDAVRSINVVRGGSSDDGMELFGAARGGELDRVAFAVDGVESGHGRSLAMWRPEPDGPQGPMQVSAAAALDVGGGDRFDVHQNRLMGRAYLALLYQRYGNWPDAIAAYNWGPGNLDQWIAAGRPVDRLPLETARYLLRVLREALLSPS